MAAPAEKKRFADAVVSRFGKGMGPAAPASTAAEDDDGGGDDSGTDNEAAAMLRKSLKSGDNAALCEAIRRICG